MKLNNGFTLIELLVVIAISLVVLGGALAAFINYSERRSVLNAANELKTYLVAAQNRANAGDLGGCDQLAGYRVQTYLNGNVTEMSSQAVCETGTADTARIQQLPGGVTVSPNVDVTFQVLNAGFNLDDASEDVTVSGGSNSYLFTIYREGRVSEGDWQ